MLGKDLISIGEMSKISGVHPNSLRYYEKIGILKPVYINPETKYRYYTYAQLYTMRAITSCIRLNIPLKKFIDFTDNNDIIFSEKLIELAKVETEKKIQDIQNNLDIILFLKSKLEINKQLISKEKVIDCTIPPKYCLIIPINERSSNDKSLSFAQLFSLAKKEGHLPSYEAGLLYVYHDRTNIERYLYLEIVAISKKNTENIIHIPSKRYSVKSVSQGAIETVEEEFPELFTKSYSKYIIETNFLTEQTNIKNILSELRCSLPE